MNRMLKTAAGPEYDVLRLLPGAERDRIWTECVMCASQTPWAVGVTFALVFTGISLVGLFHVLLAPVLGGGLLLRLASDALVLHVLLHPFIRMRSRHVVESARPFVRKELALVLDPGQYQFLLETVTEDDPAALDAVRAAAAGRR